MTSKKTVTPEHKQIAIIAHDSKKPELLTWAKSHRSELAKHKLLATGTTGTLLENNLELTVEKVQSGPLGGDQQIGAKIVEGKVDFIIFFWDPLEAQPHDPDVKALLRLAVVWNIPLACNAISADFMLLSPLMKQAYQRKVPDYANHTNREIPA